MNCPETIPVKGEQRTCLHLARYPHRHYTAVRSGELRDDGQPKLDVFTWER